VFSLKVCLIHSVAYVFLDPKVSFWEEVCMIRLCGATLVYATVGFIKLATKNKKLI